MDIAKTRTKSKQIIDKSILKTSRNSNLPQKMYHHVIYDKDLDEHGFLLKALKSKHYTVHINKYLDDYKTQLKDMIFLVKIGLFKAFRKHHILYFKLTKLGLSYGIQFHTKYRKKSLSRALISIIPLLMAIVIVNIGGLLIDFNSYNLFCLCLTDLFVLAASFFGIFLKYISNTVLPVTEIDYLPYLRKHTNHHQYLIIKNIIRSKDSYYSGAKY